MKKKKQANITKEEAITTNRTTADMIISSLLFGNDDYKRVNRKKNKK